MPSIGSPESTIRIRGASGINLFVHPSSSESQEQFRDLIDCQNIDLSLERSVMPRRGLARVTSWYGLFTTSDGKLRTGETSSPSFGVDINSIHPNVGSITPLPGHL